MIVSTEIVQVLLVKSQLPLIETGAVTRFEKPLTGSRRIVLEDP